MTNVNYKGVSPDTTDAETIKCLSNAVPWKRIEKQWKSFPSGGSEEEWILMMA